MKEKSVFITQNEQTTVEEFAFYLRSVRESLELSQAEMANIIGYSQTYYRLMERGERLPVEPYETLFMIREYIKHHKRMKREGRNEKSECS